MYEYTDINVYVCAIKITQISTRIIASIPKYKCSYTCTITLFL